jgi:hypothetical protein
VVSHLLPVPARADAEQEAPSRHVVERRHLLRRDDRIALDHEADAGAELQPLRDRRRGGERDERVEDVAVLARQLTPAGVGRVAADRDVRVLRHEERLEPELLGPPPELRGPHPVVGEKVGEA